MTAFGSVFELFLPRSSWKKTVIENETYAWGSNQCFFIVVFVFNLQPQLSPPPSFGKNLHPPSQNFFSTPSAAKKPLPLFFVFNCFSMHWFAHWKPFCPKKIVRKHANGYTEIRVIPLRNQRFFDIFWVVIIHDNLSKLILNLISDVSTVIKTKHFWKQPLRGLFR